MTPSEARDVLRMLNEAEYIGECSGADKLIPKANHDRLDTYVRKIQLIAAHAIASPLIRKAVGLDPLAPRHHAHSCHYGPDGKWLCPPTCDVGNGRVPGRV